MRPEFKVKVVFEAKVSPSEDVNLVSEAVENLIGQTGPDVPAPREIVRLESEDSGTLGHIRDQLRDRKVRGAARRMLLRDMEGNSSRLMFNRQAALAGVVVVCSSPEESPLGPIYLTLNSERIESVIDWLTGYPSG